MTDSEWRVLFQIREYLSDGRIYMARDLLDKFLSVPEQKEKESE